MTLVTTTCNQCEQGRHNNCPAEIPFINNPGNHCACAADKHLKIPKNEKESPKVKSMFSKVKDNDPHVPEQEIVEE